MRKLSKEDAAEFCWEGIDQAVTERNIELLVSFIGNLPSCKKPEITWPTSLRTY